VASAYDVGAVIGLHSEGHAGLSMHGRDIDGSTSTHIRVLCCVIDPALTRADFLRVQGEAENICVSPPARHGVIVGSEWSARVYGISKADVIRTEDPSGLFMMSFPHVEVLWEKGARNAWIV